MSFGVCVRVVVPTRGIDGGQQGDALLGGSGVVARLEQRRGHAAQSERGLKSTEAISKMMADEHDREFIDSQWQLVFSESLDVPVEAALRQQDA